MSYLTFRAEQALIGAMLADDAPPAVVRNLRSEDLSHPAYGHAFTHIANLRDQQPDLKGDALAREAAERINIAPITAEKLIELRETCPTPDHVLAYAQMVQAAGFRRDVAMHAERIVATAGSAGAAPHMARLAEALARQVHVHSHLMVDNMAARQEPRRATMTVVDEVPEFPQDREDAVLAAVINQPDLASTFARCLPAETFGNGMKRELYRAAISLAEQGDPIDEVILAWHVDNLRSITMMRTGVDDVTTPDVAYLSQLANTKVDPVVAVNTAQHMLAFHVRHQLAHHVMVDVTDAMEQRFDPEPALDIDTGAEVAPPSITEPGPPGPAPQ